jgi:radical SAM superfamily enzyme YgiQ (UPF0313 family)
MVDALFIYNDSSAHSGYSTGLGLASISAYVRRHGFSTDLIYYDGDLSESALAERLCAASPSVVGYYGPSSGFPAIRMLTERVRRILPGAFQVLGGPHAILQPEVLLDAPDLDAACVGLGEVPTLHLLERLRDGGDPRDVPGMWTVSQGDGGPTITRNPPSPCPESADDILGYDYDLFLREMERRSDFRRADYNLEVMLSRGCPFDCAYCSNRALRKAMGGKTLRPSVDASIRLLKDALETTRLRRIEFHDEILTIDRTWFREFISRYAEEVRTPFWCNLRAGTFREEDVAALKMAGAERVFIGLESGNDHLRRAVLKKTVTEAQLGSSIGWLKAHGIDVVTQNLIGLPYETPVEFLDTVRLNAVLAPEYSILSVFYPYPGTELEEVCRRLGLLGETPVAGVVDRTDSILSLPGFAREEILFYRRHFSQFVRYEQLRASRMGAVLPPLTTRSARHIARVLDARRAVVARIAETSGRSAADLHRSLRCGAFRVFAGRRPDTRG